MNVLTAKEILKSSALKSYLILLDRELKEFREGNKTFTRKPIKINGKFYLEQLVKNSNGTFSTTKVLVSNIKSGKFKEQTLFSS